MKSAAGQSMLPSGRVVLLYRVALWSLIFSCFLAPVGLTSNYWGKGGLIHYGLWKYCHYSCEWIDPVFMHGYMLAARILALVATLLQVGVVMTVLTMWWRGGVGALDCLFSWFPLPHIAILTSGVLLISAWVCFFLHTYHPTSVSWSCFVTLKSGTLGVCAAVCFLLARILTSAGDPRPDTWTALGLSSARDVILGRRHCAQVLRGTSKHGLYVA